ncbi:MULTISPECIES: DUF3967 domain-containing protein [Bacillaceae]|uniref:DUF3967 domain-containing protein n=1 Tax=Bacillaceae TaxID=186817 RepID=UPI00101BBD58|nr:DUF3967 domain-containing protein [Ectobacillus funiculus]
MISLGIPLAGLDGAQGFWDEYLKEVIHNQKKKQTQIEHNRSDKENKRDEQLMSLIRNMQEAKKMIATTEEKKSWIAKLLGK